ncbi:MAG: hypothetical protein K2X28_01345 [Alphaproteobacteria bacterium]|nr:hypothetical protein [Alphaproteobacteria bacterium]
MSQISRKIHRNSVASTLHLITDYRLLMTTLALALSGCMGVYEGGFECPPGEGVGCKSISEVNQMVDQGLGHKSPSLGTDPQKTEDNEPVCKKGSGSCATSPEIWYAPGFEVIHNEKCQTQDLDDQFFI